MVQNSQKVDQLAQMSPLNNMKSFNNLELLGVHGLISNITGFMGQNISVGETQLPKSSQNLKLLFYFQIPVEHAKINHFSNFRQNGLPNF